MIVNPLNWDQYFMSMAEVAASKSKDPSTKVGCLIVDENNHIVSTGYNGFPAGFNDTHKRWQKPEKYSYVCHSEMNALIHSVVPVKNCKMYTTMYPCDNCAKYIANSGIKEIIYKEEAYKNEVSELIFKECGIIVRKI